MVYFEVRVFVGNQERGIRPAVSSGFSRALTRWPPPPAGDDDASTGQYHHHFSASRFMYGPLRAPARATYLTSTPSNKMCIKLFLFLFSCFCFASFTSLCSAPSRCTSEGKWEAALQLLELMPSEEVTPDLVTHNIALDACVKVRVREWQRNAPFPCRVTAACVHSPIGFLYFRSRHIVLS